MKLAVLIKQVPDSDDVKMDPVKGTMIRDGANSIVNPLDLNALEAAFALRDEFGGEITVISMGPPSAEWALRETLSLGADSAVLLSDRLFAGADSWATSLTLTKALKKLGPFDVVLAGEKATDGETGQVGPEVAALLNVPCATYVSSVKFTGSHIIAERSIEDGRQTQKIQLPCLLTVLNNINEPQMPTLSGKKRARRMSVAVLSAEDLEIRKEEAGLTGSPTRVVKIEHPKLFRQTEFYRGKELSAGVEKVVETLRSLSVI